MTEYLSVTAAARRAGVSPDTIRRWCDKGDLPSIRTSGMHRRVSEEALDALLTDGPATAPQLTRDTRNLAAALDGIRDQVLELRPFAGRRFDTRHGLQSALESLTGNQEAGGTGLIGELQGLAEELRDATAHWAEAHPPRPLTAVPDTTEDRFSPGETPSWGRGSASTDDEEGYVPFYLRLPSPTDEHAAGL